MDKRKKKGMGYLEVRTRETTKKKARAQDCAVASASGITKETQTKNIYSHIRRIVKQAGTKEGCSRRTACDTRSKENRCLPISVPTRLVVRATYCPGVDFRMNCQPSPYSCPSLTLTSSLAQSPIADGVPGLANPPSPFTPRLRADRSLPAAINLPNSGSFHLSKPLVVLVVVPLAGLLRLGTLLATEHAEEAEHVGEHAEAVAEGAECLLCP